jgi:hypothetical protein
MDSTAAAPGMAKGHLADRQIRLMLQVGLLVFVWVIAIGIINGLGLMELTRPLLLSHLHGGMLGWLTLGILAATLWLFGGGDTPPSERSLGIARALSYLAMVAVVGYVAAFATTSGVVRPIAGLLTFTALAGFGAWALTRTGSVVLTVPRLLVLVGLLASVIGGAFGVINGLSIALGFSVPASFFGAHPGSMTVGFIMPVAMGLAEWGLRRDQPDEPASRPGKVQVGLMALAFVWVLGMTLAERDEIAGMGVVFAILALVIFLVRIWPFVRRTSLLARRPERHALAGGLLLGVTIIYIFVAIQAAGGDFTQIPRERIIAFTHLEAVAATTNAMLAFVVYLSRRVTPPSAVDDVVFWGLNLGVVGFVVALTAELPGLYVLFVPVMGLSLLLAVGVHVAALRAAPAGT